MITSSSSTPAADYRRAVWRRRLWSLLLRAEREAPC